MSLTITTLDGRAGADQTFTLLGADNTGSTRLDTASTLTEPKRLNIKHSSSGQGAAAIDRHLIQTSNTKLNTAGVARTATVNLTIAVPRDTVITAAIVEDLISNIISLMSGGAFSTTTGLTSNANITALLRGES